MTRSKAERELRARIKRSLGLATPRFNVLWKKLTKDGVVDFVLNGSETEEWLAQEARSHVDFFKSMALADDRRGRKKTVEMSVHAHMSEYEKLYASALASHLAGLADKDWDVGMIRDRLLGGKVISARKAKKLIQSPAAQMMRHADFEKAKIPILGHSASTQVVPNILRLNVEEDQWIKFFFKIGSRSQTVNYRRTTHYNTPNTAKLAVPISLADSTACAWIRIWRGSILDEVRIVAERLQKHYGFRVQEATGFLLTGTPASFKPLVATSKGRAGSPLLNTRRFGDEFTYMWDKLYLEISPWMSNRAVLSALQDFRKQSLGKRDLRRPHLRSIKVLRFVSDAARKSGGGLDWPDLLRSWNKSMTARPKWRFQSSATMKENYQRTVTNVVMQQPVAKSKKRC